MIDIVKSISYIGMGSNLSAPELQLKKALTAINQVTNITIICYSNFYNTKPLGPQDQPNYVNAVAKISTSLLPDELLHALKVIENKHGRKQNTRWSSRIIDLDILLYDNLILNTELLTIPHKQLKYRDFVLYPLMEICPDLRLPTGEHINTLIKKNSNNNYVIHN